MEFKGTKGEWKEDIGIDLLNDDLHQIIVYSKHVNTHNVAHVFAFNQEEAEANAKLIAYAPEMLALLGDIQVALTMQADPNFQKLINEINELREKATTI